MLLLDQHLSLDDCRDILAELPSFRVPQGDAGERIDLGGSALHRATAAAHRAFAAAAARASHGCRREALEALSLPSTALMLQAVVYGLKGSMAPHCDASVGRRPKDLAILSFGCACDFSTDRLFDLRSGSALVFDAASVLHGVARIKPHTSPLSALDDARIALMFWAAPPALLPPDDADPDPGVLYDEE